MNDFVKKQIKTYFLSNTKEEMCGVVSSGGNGLIFHRISNIHHDKKNNFKLHYEEFLNVILDYGEIKYIVHSHINGKGPSFVDKINCNNTKIDYIIYDILNNEFYYLKPKNINYLNLPFEIGVNDCYSLVRNFYYHELDIQLHDYSRNESWFTENKFIFDGNFKNEDFYVIDIKDLQEFDCILFALSSKNESNHIGIYLGNNIFLHHPRNKNSQLQELNDVYKRKIKYAIRHKNIK